MFSLHLLRPPEVISDAALRHDVLGIAGIVLQLFTQPPHGNIDGADVSVILVTPDFFQQLLSGARDGSSYAAELEDMMDILMNGIKEVSQ